MPPTQNTNGLTLAQWASAAGMNKEAYAANAWARNIIETDRAVARAWRAGADPVEWRAQQDARV